jgi:L-asparaginase
VFTGAMRPQKMIDSDAAFNIGAAVSALSILGTGVYLTMNGRVHAANSVRRDGRTGHFVSV